MYYVYILQSQKDESYYTGFTEFFPKKTDFNKVTLKEIKRAQDLLNGRPRKVLGWKKPNEVFQNLIALEV